MDLSALLLFFYTSGLFQKGLTDLIRTQPTVMAAVGDEALLNCDLLQSKDVVQVIWWRILPNGMDNVITQHKERGQKVNPDFRDKVEFTDAGLQNSSIVIRNVTDQDEGCYCCLFNIDPGDDLNATTCLQLFGFSEDSGIEITAFTTITILSVVLSIYCVAAAVTAVTVLLIWKHSNRQRQEIF